MKVDPKPLLRLIAIRFSGNEDVYTISQSHEGFKFEGPVTFNKVVPNPLPNGTFVVDAKTGASCKADRQRFMDMLHFHEKEVGPVVLVAAGMKGVRSFLNITGERIGKAEWSAKSGSVVDVQIVERLGRYTVHPPYRMLTPPSQVQVPLLRSLTTRCMCILCLAWSIYAALRHLPPFSGIYIEHRLLDMTDLGSYTARQVLTRVVISSILTSVVPLTWCSHLHMGCCSISLGQKIPHLSISQ